MKLVLIEWLDAHSGRGWIERETLEQATEPLYCRSVGWLVAETEECTVIVPHINGGETGDIFIRGLGDINIPKISIVKTTVLEIDLIGA